AVFPTEYGSFGISFAYSSSGKIPKYENFTYLGDFNAYDMVGTVAYAARLGDFMSLGGSFKLIQQKIEEESGFGYAFDIGIHKYLDPEQKISIGAAVQNIGPDIKFINEADPLPFKIKGGMAVSLGSFKVTGDITSPKNEDVYFNFGGQLAIGEILALRAGYNGEQKMTAGAGVVFHDAELGFSYVPMEELGSSTMLSLAFKF
ncbi:MAG: PorV/PorQ family protein, partial [candidate division Zixibacteria bacterium]|nr:PorV/PorQ family protein [candidate division Zixibacteria bacterium]